MDLWIADFKSETHVIHLKNITKSRNIRNLINLDWKIIKNFKNNYFVSDFFLRMKYLIMYIKYHALNILSTYYIVNINCKLYNIKICLLGLILLTNTN